MTEEVKPKTTRKPRTKVAPSTVETPKESPAGSSPAPTVTKETALPLSHDLVNFKGSFVTRSGAVITYL